MIVLFPMLISKSVSPNSVPGLCKTLEKFVLVYKMNDVLKAAGLVGATIGAGKLAVSSLLKTEQIIIRKGGSGVPEEAEKGKSGKSESDHDLYDLKKRDSELKELSYQKDLVKTKAELERNKKEDKLKALDNWSQSFKFDVTFPSTNSISIEPTWVIVSSRSTSQIIGVKVIPFYIDTDSDVLATMLHDNSLSGLDSQIHKFVRKVGRVFYAVIRKLPLPFMPSRVISDNIEESILFAKTEHGKNVFLCLNYSDFNNSEIVLNAKTLSKLFSLGWTSFIAADDINKRAIFCMKEFRGMCSSIPYSFLYSSISRDAAKVYENIEDVKKSASPFFRTLTSTKKVFGESIAYQKLNKYLSLLNS